MNFKVSLSLPKLVRFKVGVRLGVEEWARLDVRVKLRGGRAWKWTAMADPGRRAIKASAAESPPLLGRGEHEPIEP